MNTKPALSTLVGAYLNQDVFDSYPDEMAAVDDFVELDPSGAAVLPDEIDHILASHSDAEIDAVLKTYGIGFIPGDIGYRGWLTQIAERVRAATG